MKQKFINAHMEVAKVYAKLSSAVRLQVGCVIVKDNRIVSIGYNGMPAGWDNCCEEEVITEHETHLVTKPEVLHAETNAIAKLARSSESGEDATMFITHAPCMDCAKLIHQAGISKVYFGEEYRDSKGTAFLHKCGVEVKKT